VFLDENATESVKFRFLERQTAAVHDPRAAGAIGRAGAGVSVRSTPAEVICFLQPDRPARHKYQEAMTGKDSSVGRVSRLLGLGSFRFR